MTGRLQPVVKAALLALLCLPLPASAGGIFAPFILHPIRREISAAEITKADRSFARENATREDFAVTARDGVVLKGWKVRAGSPTATGLCCFMDGPKTACR